MAQVQVEGWEQRAVVDAFDVGLDGWYQVVVDLMDGFNAGAFTRLWVSEDEQPKWSVIVVGPHTGWHFMNDVTADPQTLHPSGLSPTTTVAQDPMTVTRWYGVVRLFLKAGSRVSSSATLRAVVYNGVEKPVVDVFNAKLLTQF